MSPNCLFRITNCPSVLLTSLLSTFLFAELQPGALAEDFYVAAGSSEGDGSKFKPFATLAAAVTESRLSPGPHRILIQSGLYYDVAVQLSPKDSGLLIENVPGHSPILYGGVPLGGWQAEGKFQVAQLLPPPSGRPWDIRLLLVNDESRPRARYPSAGTLTHETTFNVPWMSTTGGGWQRRPTSDELTTLKYKAGDLGSWLEVTNAEITVYHMWDESCIGLAAIDPDNRTLRLAPASGHPPGAFGVKKYVLWNIKEGLTEPGQWYHDRARNRIVYWPKPGEDVSKLRVIVPTQTNILSLRGSPDEPIKDITVRGLTFAGTTSPLIAGGFAAAAFDGTSDPTHLEQLEASLTQAEAIAPRAKRMLGCYLVDYRRKEGMPVALMERQCELGLRWLKEHRIEGIIFLGNTTMDLGFASVEWTREWIQKVGKTRL